MRRLAAAHDWQPGATQRAHEDPVRLAQLPSLAFAAATVAAFESGTSGKPARMFVNFFGLFGPNGPLPLHLTEYARDRLHNHHDATFPRFADVFHNRLLALLYRAWAQGQPAVSIDRWRDGEPSSDAFGVWLASLIGSGMDALRERDAVLDMASLASAHHLVRSSRNAEGLRSMLEDFFRVPVRVEECVGYWATFPIECQTRLGETLATGALGRTATLGTRYWDGQGKFRLRFGPLRLARLRDFLPAGGRPSRSLERLTCMVRSWIGDELTWDLQLVLRKDEVPELRLGGGERLAWTTWLPAAARDSDLEDTILSPTAPRNHDE